MAATQDLRGRGLKIVSPAELDNREDFDLAMSSRDGALIPGGKTWADFLARDVKLIADEVQGVILMPGWKKSRGAKLEAFISLLCEHKFKTYHGPGAPLQEVPARYLMTLIHEGMVL
jgi:hypothetical protein